MNDLRWILAAIGAVIVIAIYLSGRFERDAWRRDRESPRYSVPVRKPLKEKKHADQEQRHERKEPHIGIVDNSELNHSGESETSINGNVESNTRHGFVVDTREKLVSDDEIIIRQEDPEIRITENEKIVRDSSVGIGIRSEEDVERAIKRQNTQPQKIDSSHEVSEVKKDTAELIIKPDIKDEIVEIEIPEEFSAPEEKTEPELESEVRAVMNEPVQQELVLEIEPLVLVLTVMAKGGAFFNGSLIKKVLEGSDLNIDEQGIFNFFMTGKTPPIFSVVSVIEPGVFDMSTIREYETPGLSFFCQLPGSLPNADIFRIMHMKALNIAEKLGGQLCDDRRNRLTEQSLAHYNDRVNEFGREMVLARKKKK